MVPMSNSLNWLNGTDMPSCGMHADKYRFFENFLSKNNSLCKFDFNKTKEQFYICKNRWLANARFSRFLRHRSEIEQKHLLFMDNRVFQMAFIEIRRVILEYQQLPLLPKLFP